MQYFGGKFRIAKELASFLNTQLEQGQPFMDLFCGSCNVISKIDSNRLRFANDLHTELIALHKHVQKGGALPTTVSEIEYTTVRNDKQSPAWLRAFIGFGCSFGGKYFGGYARTSTSSHMARQYARQAAEGLLKKHLTMGDVIFSNFDYGSATIEPHSLIYCDIPYKGTTEYSVGSFNHDKFYKWAESIQQQGCDVYVSEYLHNVPENWSVVWRKVSKQDMRSKIGRVETIEILMTPPKTEFTTKGSR